MNRASKKQFASTLSRFINEEPFHKEDSLHSQTSKKKQNKKLFTLAEFKRVKNQNVSARSHRAYIDETERLYNQFLTKSNNTYVIPEGVYPFLQNFNPYYRVKKLPGNPKQEKYPNKFRVPSEQKIVNEIMEIETQPLSLDRMSQIKIPSLTKIPILPIKIPSVKNLPERSISPPLRATELQKARNIPKSRTPFNAAIFNPPTPPPILPPDNSETPKLQSVHSSSESKPSSQSAQSSSQSSSSSYLSNSAIAKRVASRLSRRQGFTRRRERIIVYQPFTARPLPQWTRGRGLWDLVEFKGVVGEMHYCTERLPAEGDALPHYYSYWSSCLDNFLQCEGEPEIRHLDVGYYSLFKENELKREEGTNKEPLEGQHYDGGVQDVMEWIKHKISVDLMYESQEIACTENKFHPKARENKATNYIWFDEGFFGILAQFERKSKEIERQARMVSLEGKLISRDGDEELDEEELSNYK